MNWNDLVKRGDVLKEAVYLNVDTNEMVVFVQDIKKIPAVPQEMSAIEYGDTLIKICASHNGRCADCEIEKPCAIPDRRTVPIVEAWAREHPEKSGDNVGDKK